MFEQISMREGEGGEGGASRVCFLSSEGTTSDTDIVGFKTNPIKFEASQIQRTCPKDKECNISCVSAMAWVCVRASVYVCMCVCA